MKVGFIGLGIMGGGMAANLLKRGIELIVFNRTAQKAEALVAEGATLASSVAELAQQVDVVISMLAHPETVSAIQSELLSNLPQGALWIDCSTTHPSFVRASAAAALGYGVRYVSAPVAGSKHQAAGGQLAFFCGGNSADIAQAQPLFDAMGQRTVHVGDEHAAGTSLKLVINHLLGTSMAAFAEGLALGEGLGLSRELLLNALVGAVVTPAYMGSKKEKLASGEYAVEFPLRWMQKDMHMVATAAYETGVPMPLANITKEVFQAAVTHGLGDSDFSAVGSR